MSKHCTTLRYLSAFVAAALSLAATSSAAENHTKYLIANDQVTTNKGNTASFYVPGGTSKAPTLKLYKTVPTGGTGMQDNYIPAPQLVIAEDSCVYLSEPGSNDVAGIVASSQKVVGNFKGSATDTGGQAIGLAVNKSYLYASFTGSNTLATFKIGSGCKLRFVAGSDVGAIGLNGGSVNGIFVHGKLMVVAYGDGSIESFNISHGVPVSNGDKQLSTGYGNDGGRPSGVEITLDGHYAIFGDEGKYVEVEVSDISSGKLTKTADYGGASGGLGHGMNSDWIWLSPDESLLYVGNNESGNIVAARFDRATGVLSAGCESGTLKGYGSNWHFSASVVTGGSGTGSPLYVAEFEPSSFVGVLDVIVKGGTCKITESKNSPVNDQQSGYVENLGAYPRSF